METPFDLKSDITTGSYSKRSRIIGSRSSNYRFRYSNIETCYYSRNHERQGCVLGTVTGAGSAIVEDVADIVGRSPSGGSLQISRNSPQSGLRPASYWAGAAEQLGAFDLDGDGFDDLLSLDGRQLSWARTDGGVIADPWLELGGTASAPTNLVGVIPVSPGSGIAVVAASNGAIETVPVSSGGLGPTSVVVPASEGESVATQIRSELGAVMGAARVQILNGAVTLDPYLLAASGGTVTASEVPTIELGAASGVAVQSIDFALQVALEVRSPDVAWYDPSTGRLQVLVSSRPFSGTARSAGRRPSRVSMFSCFLARERAPPWSMSSGNNSPEHGSLFAIGDGELRAVGRPVPALRDPVLGNFTESSTPSPQAP